MDVRPDQRRDRLRQLITRLEDGRVVVILTLAWWLGVSERTIYRDLDALRAAGHRIDTSRGRGGGIMLRRRKAAA
jgi:predicted DNA-binding transcriptional regulator YafY